MKHVSSKRLVVRADTIRKLGQAELSGVKGGTGLSDFDMCGAYSEVPYNCPMTVSRWCYPK